MNSKEALHYLSFLSAGDENKTRKCRRIIKKDLDRLEKLKKELKVLKILKRKGVAVGFIQLQIKENCGGVREYNDYIWEDKSLHLTANEYEKIKEWIENDK